MNNSMNNSICKEPTQTLDPYQAHQQAVAEWNEACHSFRSVEQRKQIAAKRLAETTQQLVALLQAAPSDPTQQLQEVPGNPVAMGMNAQARY